MVSSAGLALLFLALCSRVSAGEVWIPLGYLGTAPVAGSVGGVKAISAGYGIVLTLKQDGRVVTWGAGSNNGQGQVPLAAESGVSAIAVAAGSSYALKNGQVLYWGGNYRVLPDAVQSGVTAIAAGGDHALALKAGSVIAWGTDDFGESTIPSGLSGVTAIAAGYYHSLALSGGAVVAWGWNDFGQCTIPTAATNGVSAIAGGWLFSVALKNGGVITWGGYVPTVPAEATQDITAIAAGDSHVLALTSAGGVIAFGDNFHGQCQVPAGALSNVIAIAAASNYSLALKVDGSLLAWGYDIHGAVTVPAAIAGSTSLAQSEVQLLYVVGGAVSRWGSDYANINTINVHLPLPAATGDSVTAIATNQIHSLALKGQQIIPWGSDSYAQDAIPAGAASGVTAIAEGYYHSLALVGGNLFAWGDNTNHQTEIPNSGLDDATTGVDAIVAGNNHSLALKAGRVIAWGDNAQHQTEVPVEATSGVTAIAAGALHSVALTSSHQVLAWGYNNAGTATVPSAAASGVVAISAGGNHTMALKDNGSVLVWGSNDEGASLQSGLVSGVSAIYAGASQSWVRRAGRLPVVITLGDRVVLSDGTPKGLTSISVNGVGGIIPPVNCTFNGATDYPSAVGVYTVVATVDCAAYRGSATAMLTIVDSNQTISFPDPGTQTYGSSITLQATASSGLPLSYSISPSSAGILIGSQLTITSSSGSVLVTANQAGDPFGAIPYIPAPTVSRSLALIPAPLTVQANDVTAAKDASMPTFTWSLIGLRLGDSPASTLIGVPTLGSSATDTHTAGTFPITVGLGGVSAANYSLVGVGATLTVTTNLDQSLTFTSPGSQSYGSVIVLGASSTSALAVSYQVLSGSSTVSGNQLTIRDSSGTVVIEASQAGNATYAAATPVQVSFAASPATLTVQADAKSMAQGASVPALSWQVSGLKLADTTSVLNGVPALSTTATSSSPLGNYPITVSVSGVSTLNYTVIAGNSTLTVSAGGAGAGSSGGGGGGGCGLGSGLGALLALLGLSLALRKR